MLQGRERPASAAVGGSLYVCGGVEKARLRIKRCSCRKGAHGSPIYNYESQPIGVAGGFVSERSELRGCGGEGGPKRKKLRG